MFIKKISEREIHFVVKQTFQMAYMDHKLVAKLPTQLFPFRLSNFEFLTPLQCEIDSILPINVVCPDCLFFSSFLFFLPKSLQRQAAAASARCSHESAERDL